MQTHKARAFDARRVREVVESNTSAYLASHRTTMLAMAGLVALVAILCFWILARRPSSS